MKKNSYPNANKIFTLLHIHYTTTVSSTKHNIYFIFIFLFVSQYRPKPKGQFLHTRIYIYNYLI